GSGSPSWPHDADSREVEHHEIGGQPFADLAAVAEAHDPRGLEHEMANRVLEAQELARPHPFRQHGSSTRLRAEVVLRRAPTADRADRAPRHADVAAEGGGHRP